MDRRVVITGIGIISSMGIGRKEFFENLLAQKSNICEIPQEYKKRYNFKSLYHVPAPSVNLRDYGIPSSVENAMEEASKFGVGAAKLALEDAGFKVGNGDKYFNVEGLEQSNIIVGLGIGSIGTALNSYVAHVFTEDKEILEKKGISCRYNRMVIPMLMPNSVSSWISILFGIKGGNYTINASCASGTFAIGEAYLRIKSGLCKSALTGGVECLKEEQGGIMRGFDMLSTLTRAEKGFPMPFSKKRSGFLFNEGVGCILVLEELQVALDRGAHIYAEICGYQSSSDAYSIVQMENSGGEIVKLIKKLTNGSKVDYLNAHATGTEQNDQIEGRAIQEVFGDMENQPYISATKGVLGHSIGASGAIEAAVTAMSIDESVIHGCRIEDSMENLNLIHESKEAEIQCGLSLSFGFGGHNGGILLRKSGGMNG